MKLAPNKSRNNNPISSKEDLHSIESTIAAEAKITNLMRKLEVLKIKDPASVNQVSQTQVPTPGCTYCQAMNHVFEEYLIFLDQQMLPEHMNAAF